MSLVLDELFSLLGYWAIPYISFCWHGTAILLVLLIALYDKWLERMKKCKQEKP